MLKRDEPIFLIRVDAQFQLGVNLTSGKLWEGWHSVPLRGVRGNQVDVGVAARCWLENHY